jgi:glycosyltransferase involved in cell wall biosynthesis
MKNKSVKKKKRNPRIMLGIIEISGDLWEYRNALRKLGVQADTVVFQKDPFYDLLYDKYYPIKRNKLSGFLKSIPITLKLIFQYDIFFFIFGQSFFPRNLDIYLLKLLRKKVVVFFCGCDIRCREEVLKEHRPFSFCQECENICDTKAKRKLANFWEKYADLIFSDPEQSQLLKKPYHHTILCLDLDYWRPFQSNITQESNKVLIAHAPTDRKLKGTKYIIEAINRLQNERNSIELVLLESMSIKEVRSKLNETDIVVDQLLCGWYGKLAIESMAMAKPTICYIDNKIKAQMNYGNDLPIVISNPTKIYEDLKFLIDNPRLRKEIGSKSRSYVEATHSQEVVGNKLKILLENLYNK